MKKTHSFLASLSDILANNISTLSI